MSNPVILVIDDEKQIRKLLNIALQSHAFIVHESETAHEGLIAAASHPPDLIILDIGLPDANGQDVLLKLREWFNKPILILSVQSDEDNIVRALDNGANDYLVKPFRTGELLARIRTLLRFSSNTGTSHVITFNNLQIDLSARTVKKNGELVKLTATEYNLLALFVKNEGKVLTHQFLLREVWGPSHTSESQYLRVFVAQLRKKIENDQNKPLHIITESGIGYRFTAATQ